MEIQPSQATASHVSWTPAEIGALAHLYRGEMYQSKIWRVRLDTTTNWAVVVTGIALSVAFTSENASPMPLLLVSWVVVMFLLFESRRYLFYDLFRVRLRVMEINFYAPMLRGQGIQTANGWNDLLAADYMHLHFHISLMESIGRRIRRTYGWLFFAQMACWVAKIIVHPTPLTSFNQLWERAAIGPLSGQAVVAIGVLFHLTWIVIAVLTLGSQRAVGLPSGRIGPDPLLNVAGSHSAS